MKKLNAKEYIQWLRMDREWPSANDAYNIDVYGITCRRYHEIKRAATRARGIEAGKATLKEINGQLAQAPWEKWEED